MTYSLRALAHLQPGTFYEGCPAATEIEYLLTDSRQLIYPEKTLFFALLGARNDGHRYVQACYAAGVRNFVVEKAGLFAPDQLVNVWVVPQVIRALQAIARHHRQQFDLPVWAITGSNGKTVVKEWLFQLLHPDRVVVRSPRSYNSQVGVPLSLWEIRPSHDLGIFEAGISRPGEMEHLAAMIQGQWGIFTTLGPAHQEGFVSLEQKLAEKLLLFQEAALIFYNSDQPEVAAGIQALGRPVQAWSRLHSDAALWIEHETTTAAETHFQAIYRGQRRQLVVPFRDPISVENCLHCWGPLLALGLDDATIQARMRKLEPVAMRLELKAGGGDCVLINDSYNADLTSLRLALSFLAQYAQGRSQTLVLTDILQSGVPLEALFAQLAQLLRQHPIERFIGVGHYIEGVRAYLPDNLNQAYFADTAALLAALPRLAFAYEAILLKGARQYGLERVADQLALQAHQTVLEINLSALAHNVRAYSRVLQPGVRLMAMVKAAAYGAGSAEVARLLELLHVEYCCVAYADEGAALREAGIQAPILVLNPEPGAFEQMLRHKLEPKVYSLGQLDALLAFLRRREAMLPLHLSIDSGMHRLGFDLPEVPALCDRLREHPQLPIVSIFSHLAASEDPALDAFTHEQARRFLVANAQIVATLGYQPLRHLLNSNGITRFPEYQFEMVRLGIGLYGLDLSRTLPEPLRVGLSLYARIAQVKAVAAGETIGYGRRAVAVAPMRTATIAIGYADGLPRAAGNGRFAVALHGQLAPILGSICMDMTMIDVTHIPEAEAGDQVTVFGLHPQVADLAAAVGTIPYEIFTGIAPRVKRVYVQE